MSGEASAAHWWDDVPARQVSYLVGIDPELLRVAFDPLPDSAPAVVSFRPVVARSLDDQVAVVLDELDRAAVALFPHWLAEARRFAGPQGLGVAAVRVLAEQVAARSRSFGPFLADLAERGLRSAAAGHRIAGQRRFAAEVRAVGLARVIAAAYGRVSTVVMVEIPGGLTPADERGLTFAAEWLVHHGGLTVWLAGPPLQSVDRLRSVVVALPAQLTQLLTDAQALQANSVDCPSTAPVMSFPALSGIPRSDSPAEQALERALAPHDWACGRRWNHTYEPNILSKRYRLDLFWADEGLVVEVDGDEHRGAVKFADDRRRDVQLQVRGYDVLRFTNDQVLSDVQFVTHEIRRLLTQRRSHNSPHRR